MFHHITVLQNEAVEMLNIKPNGIYVDATLGGGGHSKKILTNLDHTGRLIAIDQDELAINNAQNTFQNEERITILRGNFRQITDLLKGIGIDKVDGILFDIGVSSPQFDIKERGFSYQNEAALDMRMDTRQTLTAYKIINEWEEEELQTVIWKYGEEPFAKRIAKKIVEVRKKKVIETTTELAEIIKSAIPAKARRIGGHPAKQTFQALRIVVNDELNSLKEGLEQGISLLNEFGRIAVITFHSLEDRIVKETFKEKASTCTCPPDFPVCVCGNKPIVRILTKRPILPTEEEIENNFRARSAKLRVAEKIS